MSTGANEARRAQAAWSAGRRMTARREPPCYRVAETGDGSTVHVIELPWLVPIRATRSSARDRAREAIAVWLEVAPDTFDIELE